MRRQYAGGAKPAQLTAQLGGSTANLTIDCDDLSGYPDGSVGPFYVVIDRGLVNEEKILCVSRTGNTLTVYDSGLVNGRGVDGTVVSSHSIGSEIEHVFTATDADEANFHVNNDAIHGGGAKGANGDRVFWENNQSVSADYTITAGFNAGTFGPVTIDSGVTVTVPDGSTWTVA